MVQYSISDRLKDIVDQRLTALGLVKSANWDKARKVGHLYAGKLRRGLPQYKTHIGITPFQVSHRNINHDVTKPMPLKNIISVYQSEDVFEHIPYADILVVFNNIHDALKPGGLFRLSMPDYRCDILKNRCQMDGENILFDPGGGGRYVDGKVIEGGHLWFPTYENVSALINESDFKTFDILEAYAPDGSRIIKPVDYSLGYIQRTSTNDPRVKEDPRPMSIIVDMYK